MTPNLRAFLSMLAVSEGTGTSPATKCDGYDVIVTGIDGKPEVFGDFRYHPFALGRVPKVINSKGLASTASGRYQIMLRWAIAYMRDLKLADFGPSSQDAIAVQMIRECKAVSLIETGKFVEAVNACRSRWASLPGAGYGQHENSIEKLQAVYIAAGGEIL